MEHTTARPSPWLVTPRGADPDRPRLVIMPHAGGGPAFYSRLTQALEPTLACWVVHYPGRERRIADSLPSSLTELADAVAEAISGHVAAPSVLFGHSMGAAVAHEVALRIPEQVCGLILSGRGARREVAPGNSVHLLSDDALIEEVCSMNATPSEVLSHPELRAMLLPTIRSDYRIIETHTSNGSDVLEIPVVTYAGTSDPTTAPHEMSSWAERTTFVLQQREFAGDHFYFMQNLGTVAEAIIQDVSAMTE